MEAREFEETLNDLETRVDRLRALYENWFRGYEKIEPQVARKDVERRVYGLRKELPRNTALRFRYHQLYQRYTTLANYWHRTARQIEEGTHRLQVARMRRRMGPGDEAERVDAAERDNSREDSGGQKSYELDLNENFSVNDLLSDLEMEEVARAVDVPGPHSEPPAPKGTEPARSVGRFSRPKRGSISPPRTLVSESSNRSARPPAPEPEVLAKSPAAPIAPSPPASPRASLPNPPAMPGKVPPPVPPKVPVQGSPTAPGRPVAPPLPAPAGASGANRPPSPPPLAAAGTPKPPLVAQTRPGVPAPAAPSASGGNAIPAERRAPIAGGGTKVGRPPPPPGMETGSGSGVPNEQRMRRIYDEYVAARRKNNEGDVRYDALVTNIQKMLPELQKKHQGKQIDFEVVVKDGRVGLKPRAL
jgi:hypothetical protein